MKYALLIMAAMLSGCLTDGEDKAKYKVGDCFEDAPRKNMERWETHRPYIHLVQEIGVRSYRVLVINKAYLGTGRKPFPYSQGFYNDKYTVPVECPLELLITE